MTAGNRQTTDT